MSAITVRGLAVTPIKGTRLQTVDSVELDRTGARDNRRFYLIGAEAKQGSDPLRRPAGQGVVQHVIHRDARALDLRPAATVEFPFEHAYLCAYSVKARI